jgi:hypothetical protein
MKRAYNTPSPNTTRHTTTCGRVKMLSGMFKEAKRRKKLPPERGEREREKERWCVR